MGLFAYAVTQIVCWAVPSLGWAIGFGAAGPIGGTLAAAAQTFMGASIASGSYFATCQAIAMTAAVAPTP